MLCFVFAALVVILDQFIKRWILIALPYSEFPPFPSKDLIPGVIDLTHKRNTGAAFSILADQPLLLIGIAVVAVLLLIAILLRYNDGFWGTLGLAAVLGGTVGNLIDRISYGYVVDMFRPLFTEFAIFNIADIFITLGGITFLIYFIASAAKPAKREETVYEDEPVDYSQDENPRVDDQIGLYDFQYGEDRQDRDLYGYDNLSDTRPVSGGFAEQSPEMTEVYPDPVSDSVEYEPPAEITSALDVLSELEQELQETGLLDDSDLDELLREYGFEDDTDQLF